MLGKIEESVDVVGTRISRALEKDESSWVLGCLGALYWRVKGDAPNAINCLRMALKNAPVDSRVSLFSIIYLTPSLSPMVLPIILSLLPIIK